MHLESIQHYGWTLVTIYFTYRLIHAGLRVLFAIYVFFVAPALGFGVDFTKYKDLWAGCTDGIGKAYTFALQKRGICKFVLISRSEQKLKDLQAELRAASHDTETCYLVFDFLKDDYSRLDNFLAPLDTGILVNNVGMANTVLTRIAEDAQTNRNVYKVDTQPALELSLMVLPKMEKQRKGIIVSVSSIQGLRPLPLIGVYSAAKVFVSFLASVIHDEYSSYGIMSQCLYPALVLTKMIPYKKSNFFVIDPQKYADQAVGTLGVVNRTAGCFVHDILIALCSLFPWFVLKHMIKPIYLVHQAWLQKIGAQGNFKNK